jgi:hypothetical protein
MNKHDREAVCSPVFRKIFCSGPLSNDLKAEQETITALLGGMSELGKDMMHAEKPQISRAILFLIAVPGK